MEGNRQRFRKKIIKEIRDNLKRVILNKGLIEGGKVTVPWIDIPRFRYNVSGGVSHGDGDVGEALEPDDNI